MNLKTAFAGSAMTLAMALGGCASDGSLALSTGSIAQEQQQAKAQRIDPACVALMAKIDELRKEGTPERIAKVATGKSKTANVKRDALARMTELDQVNNRFQQKCSTLAAPKAKPAAPAAAAAMDAAKKTAVQKAAAEVKQTAAAATPKAVTAAQ